MLFPSSPREVYEANPLDQVICQIRYPAILAISANSPDRFQDSIRKAYPLYEEQRPPVFAPPAGMPKQVADLLASVPVPQLPQNRGHHFLTDSRARQVSLTQDFVAVTDHQYARWEDFREEVRHAEQTLREIYSPAFYTRVGLRYVDVLDRSQLGLSGTPWAELLAPTFIGMLGDSVFANHLGELQVDSLLRIPGEEQGQLHLRHGLARSGDTDEQVYLIDADFYTDRRSDSDDIFRALDKFNKLGGNLFRWATSEKLRVALGPTPI